MPYYFKWLKETVVPFSAGFLTALAVGIDWSGSQSKILKVEQDAIRNISATNCNTNK